MPFEALNCFTVSQNDTLPQVFSALSPLYNENNVLRNSNLVLKNVNTIGRLNIKPSFNSIDTAAKFDTAAEASSSNVSGLNAEKIYCEQLNIYNSRIKASNTQSNIKSVCMPTLTPTKISRVLVVTCSNVEALILLIQCSFNPADIIVQKLTISNVGNVLILGWYDLRHISIHLEFLQNLAPVYQIFNLTFSHIAEDSVLSQIICQPKLNYFEDIYDTIYLYVQSQHHHDFDYFNFQNDICFQLSKFGSLYDISMINEGFVCYKCRFYNIRTPFLMRKIHTIKIRDFKTMIFQTLIETREYVGFHLNTKATWSSGSHILPQYEILGEEWKKYQFLKHRRLGSIPFSNNEIKNENKIYLSKILSGEDQRVTLMIKNIPNKVRHEELKAFIDTTNFGDYQFLYLRIDFENHCNVGYAFVSFKDPKNIISFYEKRHEKKWKKFNSEKVCQLAYAKVQGMNNLVQKFKDSKVMSNNPDYRPRIYHTDGALKGQEMPFPQ